MSTPAKRDLLLAVTQANHEIFMLTSERSETALAALRLTNQTSQALWAINPDGAPPTMSATATLLHCNPSNLTFIAKQLESRGYLTRQRDPEDGRSQLLVLTEEGREARQAAVDAVLSVTPLATADATDLRELNRLLMRIIDNGR